MISFSVLYVSRNDKSASSQPFVNLYHAMSGAVRKPHLPGWMEFGAVGNRTYRVGLNSVRLGNRTYLAKETLLQLL